MNTNTGNRIQNAAEAVGLVGGIGSVVLGIIYWVTFRGWTGFLTCAIVSAFGIFFAWLWKVIISALGELVENSHEQTMLLRRLNENNAESMPNAKTRTEGNSVKRESAPAPVPVRMVSGQESGAGEAAKVDGSLMVAEIDSRSNLTIECPACFKRQSSRRNDCFYCGCKFIFSDEKTEESEAVPPKNSVEQAVPNVNRCKQCGSQLPEGASSCVICGAGTEADEIAPVVEKREEIPNTPPMMSFCPNCGAKITGDKKFCTKCGSRL